MKAWFRRGAMSKFLNAGIRGPFWPRPIAWQGWVVSTIYVAVNVIVFVNLYRLRGTQGPYTDQVIFNSIAVFLINFGIFTFVYFVTREKE